MAQLGDEHQGGAEDEEAPAPLVDPEQAGCDRDQGPAIEVGEEARVAPDGGLEATPAGCELAARMLRRSARARFSEGRSNSKSRSSRTSTGFGSRSPSGSRARPDSRSDSRPRAISRLVGNGSSMIPYWVGANRVSNVLNAAFEPVNTPPLLRGVSCKPNWNWFRWGSQVKPNVVK